MAVSKQEVVQVKPPRAIVVYFGNSIIGGRLTYDYVVSRRPEWTEAINEYLTEKGRQNLIPVVQSNKEQSKEQPVEATETPEAK